LWWSVIPTFAVALPVLPVDGVAEVDPVEGAAGDVDVDVRESPHATVDTSNASSATRVTGWSVRIVHLLGGPGRAPETRISIFGHPE